MKVVEFREPDLESVEERVRLLQESDYDVITYRASDGTWIIEAHELAPVGAKLAEVTTDDVKKAKARIRLWRDMGYSTLTRRNDQGLWTVAVHKKVNRE